jgi:hypothetical protein
VRAFAQGLGPADEAALEVTDNTWAIATVLASRAGRVDSSSLRLSWSNVVRRCLICSVSAFPVNPRSCHLAYNDLH